MISDTIGELLTGNTQNMKALEDRDAEIKKLKDRNEKLVAANGALLQRVPMEKSSEPEQAQDKPKQNINIKDAFDKNGNFLR